MRILVVSNKKGSATVKPFNDSKDHAGEPFWVHGKILKVGKDNRITIGKNFMEERGFLRPDGRRVFVMETGIKWLTPDQFPERKRGKYKPTRKSKLDDTHFVHGANIKTGKLYEKYYSGQTGDRLPVTDVEYTEDGDVKLVPEDSVYTYGD